MLEDDLPHPADFDQHAVHVDPHVVRTICPELVLGLGELGQYAVAVAPSHVHERAGVEDEALQEVAPVLLPRLLQHLVALPVLALVEQLDEALERQTAGGARSAHRRPNASSRIYRPTSNRLRGSTLVLP